MRKISLFMAMVLVAGSTAIAETTPADESDAIKKTALDYIEGWYAGDVARMERALHSELAKRMVSMDGMTGRSLLNQMSAITLVQRTREGIVKKIPQDRQLKEVTILDRFNNAAVVKTANGRTSTCCGN